MYEEPRIETEMGAKDALVAFAGISDLVPDDTFSYKSVKEMKKKFPSMLAKGMLFFSKLCLCVHKYSMFYGRAH